MRHTTTLALFAGILLGHAGLVNSAAHAQYAGRSFSQVPVPGTGAKIDYARDNFEEPDWRFVHNMPKSSSELNDRTYGPLAYSVNRRWAEGPERGQPDLLKVIPTPSGGLPGSTQALQISTLRSGIPGVNTNDVQQDDLIMNVAARIGSTIRRKRCRIVSCESICRTLPCGRIDRARTLVSAWVFARLPRNPVRACLQSVRK